MNSSSELHVVFGTGPMGAAIMTELLAHGKQVRLINRSGKPSLATGSPAGVEFRAADLYQPGSAISAAQGATHIYQAAQPEYHQWLEKFPPIQQAVLDAAVHHHAKLIVVENLYMYGDTNGTPIREGMPYRPSAPRKGTLRTRLTEQLMEAHARGQVRVVMGRGADFYGEGDLVLGDQIFRPILKGKSPSWIGNIDLPHTFTYTRDFGKALVILGEHDDAFGRAWHVPSPEPITQRQLITLAYEAAGLPVGKIGSLNKMMMRIGGLFIPPAREMVEMMYEFEKPFIMDSSAFTQRFGMTATPYRESVARTIAWFKANQSAIDAAAH